MERRLRSHSGTATTRSRAVAILSEMGLHSEDRNLIAHGLWEGFDAGAPYTMSILNVKKTKQRKYGVEFRRTSLSILQLRAIRDRANTLQQQLLQFSIPIRTCGRIADSGEAARL
jgi:hypothetical protein